MSGHSRTLRQTIIEDLPMVFNPVNRSLRVDTVEMSADMPDDDMFIDILAQKLKRAGQMSEVWRLYQIVKQHVEENTLSTIYALRGKP